MHRALPILIGLVAAGFCPNLSEATPPVDNPRRVICIAAGNDGFLSGSEGYYRSLAPKGNQANVVQVGGDLATCMNQVRKGDQLVVVAHGAGGQFTWNKAKGGADQTYFGYGDGTNQTFPVPPNLRGTNHVTVTLVGCNSNEDPPGEDRALTATLRDIMNAGGGAGNTVTGFDRRVRSTIRWDVKGFTRVAQRNAAEANLDANRAWMDHPPTNRPGNPPATHGTAAEAQLAGKAEFRDKGLTVNITYGAPVEEPPGPQLAGPGPFCEGVNGIPGGTVGDPVPAASGLALSLLAALLGVAGALLVRRSAPPATA